MSLPTGRQLLLFAALQLVALWGVALLLARGVTPEALDPAPADSPGFEIEWETPGLWSLVSDADQRSVAALTKRAEANGEHAGGAFAGVGLAGVGLAGPVLADGTDRGLAPGLRERAAGSPKRDRHLKRAGRWRARVHWVPGPTGFVPVPFLQKPCRKKREPAPPRS